MYVAILLVLLAAPVWAQSPDDDAREQYEQRWRAVDRWGDYSPEANARRYHDLVEQQFQQQLLYELRQDRLQRGEYRAED